MTRRPTPLWLRRADMSLTIIVFLSSIHDKDIMRVRCLKISNFLQSVSFCSSQISNLAENMFPSSSSALLSGVCSPDNIFILHRIHIHLGFLQFLQVQKQHYWAICIIQLNNFLAFTEIAADSYPSQPSGKPLKANMYFFLIFSGLNTYCWKWLKLARLAIWLVLVNLLD